MPTRRPARSSSVVSVAPQALTSGPSLLPRTACTGAWVDSSSSTLATQTSPACRITSAAERYSATPGGQRFQNRGACVSERTTMRIDSSFQPDESCIALTITRGAWRTDFTNTRKAATQHLHFRGTAIIFVPIDLKRAAVTTLVLTSHSLDSY